MSIKLNTPIEQKCIERFIDKHVRSYYEIGGLYYFLGIYHYHIDKKVLAPLIDYNIIFNYESYVALCEHGKTLEKYRATYDLNEIHIKPYSITLNYSYLNNDKKIDNEYTICHYSPITNIHTMAQTIKDSLITFQRIVRKHI